METAENARVGANLPIKSVSGKKEGQNEATKRLQRELMELMLSGVKGISAFPEGDNLFR